MAPSDMAAATDADAARVWVDAYFKAQADFTLSMDERDRRVQSVAGGTDRLRPPSWRIARAGLSFLSTG